MKETLIEWNRSNDDRTKLQYCYGILVVGLLVIAGVIGLVNDYISILLLQVVFGLAVLFIANAVMWALLKSFVLDRLPRAQSRRK